MFESALAALLISTSLYYFYFLFRILRGLQKLAFSSPEAENHAVTVIVAARNEEETIENSLRSILAQDYPAHLVEVIVVDDSSTDATVERARRMALKDSRLRILELPPHDSDLGGRKPLAIAKGVNAAQGDIILTTDADCTVKRTWIRSMSGCFGSDTAFVAGPVLEEGGKGFVSEISKVEFLGLITTAAGLIGNQTPIICNGANIAYRRSAFLKVEGYGDKHHFSDDEVLMQRIAQRNLGAILFCAEPGSFASTRSPETLRALWDQRVRWSSKKNHYENKTIVLKLLGLYSFFLILLLASTATIVFPSLIPLVAVIVLAKIAAEGWILLKGNRLFQKGISFFHFMIAEVFHVPYIVFAAFVGQFTSLRWKGKSIRE